MSRETHHSACQMLPHLLLQLSFASPALLASARTRNIVPSFPTLGLQRAHASNRMLQQSWQSSPAKAASQEDPIDAAAAPTAASTSLDKSSEDPDAANEGNSRLNRTRNGDRRRVERWHREGTEAPNNADRSNGLSAPDVKAPAAADKPDEGNDDADSPKPTQNRGGSISMTESQDAEDGDSPSAGRQGHSSPKSQAAKVPDDGEEAPAPKSSGASEGGSADSRLRQGDDESSAKSRASTNGTATAEGMPSGQSGNGTSAAGKSPLASASAGTPSNSTNSTGNSTAASADPLSLPKKVRATPSRKKPNTC
jgi:hypothetical protein